MGIHCPKCQKMSADSDFCSECGSPIVLPDPMERNSTAVSSDPEENGYDQHVVMAPASCPACGEPRDQIESRYCNSCRYDFLTHTPYVEGDDSTLGHGEEDDYETGGATVADHWELTAGVDLSLRGPDDPMPTDLRERIFPVEHDRNVIGRRVNGREPQQDIALDDPGVSRRHAQIKRQPDGSLALLDLGSTNGTKINGIAIESNILVPLKDGDRIMLGCWTHITVNAR
jgi:FHA domain/Double zinc ribbon